MDLRWAVLALVVVIGGRLAAGEPRGCDGCDALPEVGPFELSAALIGAQGGPIAMADRWRLVEGLGVRESVFNPYAQNTLKGDRPIYGRDWFLALDLESRSEFSHGRGLEASRAQRGGGLRQTLVGSLSLIRGNTVFRPPDWQLRVSAEWVYRSADGPGPGGAGRDPERALGLREVFVEKHLRTVSERYDFDHVRVGVQPFISDFRGFLFDDRQPGIRLFGNRAGNRLQYNLAWFRRRARDRELELPALRLRRDDVLVANLYYHDFPVPGFALQGTLLYDRGRERDRARGGESAMFALARRRGPREGSADRDVAYLGVSGDGHLDRLNLTFSAYAARGRERRRRAPSRAVRAQFAALEASIDFDWYRIKAYALLASGDRDPSDRRAQGFAALRENARLGGLEDGFFYREELPLGAGGRLLTAAGSLLPSLRSAADPDAPQLANPGLHVLGVGADFDVLPELQLRLAAASLRFDDTSSLEALRRADAGAPPRIARHLGEDCSLALTYRPLFIENVVLEASVAALRPGRGLRGALGLRDGSALHAARLEVVLRY